MKTCTTQVSATHPVGDARKWQVIQVSDQDDIAIPQMTIQINLLGQVNSPWPGNPYTLYVRDTGQSYVLTLNASPLGLTDQFILANVSLTGTPYTTLAAAYYGATGKNGMRLAVENAINANNCALGIIPAALFGT
jgi:hypothetical protein